MRGKGQCELAGPGADLPGAPDHRVQVAKLDKSLLNLTLPYNLIHYIYYISRLAYPNVTTPKLTKKIIEMNF